MEKLKIRQKLFKNGILSFYLLFLHSCYVNKCNLCVWPPLGSFIFKIYTFFYYNLNLCPKVILLLVGKFK